MGSLAHLALPGDVAELSEDRMSGAIFSADRTRRRYLWRDAGGTDFARLAFIMLNPSSAGAEDNDPTVTRCLGFADREGSERIEVANISDLISTDPKGLNGAQLTDGNSWHYVRYALTADIVIVAWGNHPLARGKLQTQVMNRGEGALLRNLYCLGKCRSGAPRHPLYLAAATKLEPWP